MDIIYKIVSLFNFKVKLDDILENELYNEEEDLSFRSRYSYMKNTNFYNKILK